MCPATREPHYEFPNSKLTTHNSQLPLCTSTILRFAICHLPFAIRRKPATLDFLSDGSRPRALTRRPLDAIAFLATDTEHTKEALKATYLECLKDVKSKAETLRQTVIGLLDLGVPSQQLSAWAKAAGRNDRYSQKLVSQIFLDLGIRRREPGAGPRLPREAYLVESQIRDLYGEHTFKFLRAACHVAKARDEGELPVQQIPNEPPYPDQG